MNAGRQAGIWLGMVDMTDPTPTDDPWPSDWEQRPERDTCAHQWEVHTTPNGAYGKPEQVARCAACHTPRCGHVGDTDPCLERRHHDSLHIFESGKFAPLSGLLPSDD